jgi:hypothetical protein
MSIISFTQKKREKEEQDFNAAMKAGVARYKQKYGENKTYNMTPEQQEKLRQCKKKKGFGLVLTLDQRTDA